MYIRDHRRRIKTEKMVKVVVAVWGTELIQFLATLAILHQDDLQKRLNRITATWQNGCFEKMDVPPVHITPNNHPPKEFVLTKTIFQIILICPKGNRLSAI